MPGLVRVRVIYSGTVQGVGFRFTAQRLASTYDVAGQPIEVRQAASFNIASAEQDCFNNGFDSYYC